MRHWARGGRTDLSNLVAFCSFHHHLVHEGGYAVERGDWVELGAADEQKAVKDGTVEACGRDDCNPVGGWYGLKKGLRGRFGNYVPPVLEELGLAEVEHNPRNNRMRAI